MKRIFTLFAILTLLLMGPGSSNAQFTKLMDFTGRTGQFPGDQPGYTALVSDGTYLYGVTRAGGSNAQGNIFKIRISDGSFTNLHDFTSTEGIHPEGSLITDGTYLYGTASNGGANNNGTVFKFKTDDNTFTKIYDFSGTDGGSPLGSLLLEDGYLFGTAQGGGPLGFGIVFKIKLADNTFTKIYDFNGPDGKYPTGSLISDGTFLYGMTKEGGSAQDAGVIFKINMQDNSPTVIHAFDPADGANPNGALISNGTYLYGMAAAGGQQDLGTIFKLRISDNSFLKLYDFNGSDGGNPFGSLVSDGSFLYGSAAGGGVNDVGTIFKLKISDNVFTKLYDFNGTDGALPGGTLALEKSDLYGMTSAGGTGSGVVFKFRYSDFYPGDDGILYVDSSAAGGDGSSWTKAIPKLSDALNYARTYAGNWASSGLRIFVAKGTYLPEYRADDNTKSVGDRNDAFVMVKDVKIYGGYPSGGGERGLAANPTILSGDIGSSDDASDNACHVVISAGDIGNGSLNYFIIKGGNASGSGTITVNGQAAQLIAGGGIYTVASDIRLTNLIISGNKAQSGGGIYNEASNPRITNVLITGNSASTTGGGIRVFNCLLPVLTNVTISGNSASYGGGIASAGSYLRAKNSILFGNSATTGMNVYYSGTATGFQYCLMEGTGGWNSSWGGDFGANVITTENPFVDVSKGNYQLIVSSRAINTGSNQFYDAPEMILSGVTDLAGNDRIFNQAGGGIIDMGAYELQSGPVRPDANHIIYVDSSATQGGDGSSWTTALTELSDALKATGQINHSVPGMVNQIWITSGTYYPLYTPEANMTDRDKTFMLVRDVALYGGFAGTETSPDQRLPVSGPGGRNTVLSGDIGEPGNTADNAYHVLTGIGDIAEATVVSHFRLADLIITGGNANGTSSVQLKGRTVYRNEAGGFDCRYGTPELLNCLFFKNSAVNGGAILNAYSNATGQMVNCTFAENPDNTGKAIYNYDVSNVPIQLTNCIVMNGIRYTGLEPTLTYSLVQGMAADATRHLLDGNLNPEFKNAATDDYRLAANSPAIDAGNSAANGTATDLANSPRNFGGAIDLGAYEFQGSAALPVKTSPLSGRLGKGNQVILSWYTYSESNNKGFQVEYGTDGIHFEIGLFQPSKATDGNSTTTISYKVNAGALTGVRFYRLKQIDLGGAHSYSNTIRLAATDTGFTLKAYPNPTHDFLQLHLGGVSAPEGQVIIVDLSGRILKRQRITDADTKIDLTDLAAGVYILKYADGLHFSNIKVLKK